VLRGYEWHDEARTARSGQSNLEELIMKKFMVLYMASTTDFEKAMKSSTPEHQKKGMDAWMKMDGEEQEVDR
jgi:adenosyl cobinamide kinase/adenosyl cobinamide phosphate guanylyltransferase